MTEGRRLKQAGVIRPGDVVKLRDVDAPGGWAFHRVVATERMGMRRVYIRSTLGPTWTLPREFEVEVLEGTP